MTSKGGFNEREGISEHGFGGSFVGMNDERKGSGEDESRCAIAKREGQGGIAQDKLVTVGACP